MRKNINKIVAFAIGISIMSGSVMPVFAADTTQSEAVTTVQTNKSNVLTLEDAINSAISISEPLALDNKKISNTDKINDINEDKDDFNNVSDDVEDYNKDKNKINLEKAKQQRDFDEDSLRKKVTDKYNDIVTNQMKIDYATKNIEISKKGLEDDKLRESIGMKRLYDVKSTQLALEKLQNSLKSSQNAILDAQYSFKVLTGKDVTKYSLEQDVKFEPLKIDGSIDEYLDDAIDSYLKYSSEMLKLNKDYYDRDYEEGNKGGPDITNDKINLAEAAAKAATKPSKPVDIATNLSNYEKYVEDTNTYNNTISAYTGLLASRISYLNTKLSNAQDETNLNENKKKFKDQLKTLYTNLRTSEDNINSDKKNIELANENLSAVKIKYDLGMITESAYNTEFLKCEQADIDLRNEIIAYNKIKEQLQKPWIAFSSGQ